MSSSVAGSSTTSRPTVSLLNRPEQAVLAQRRRVAPAAPRRRWSRVPRTAGPTRRRGGRRSGSWRSCGGCPRAPGSRPAPGCRRPRRRLRLARAVVLVDHHAGDADIAAELAEVFDRRADVVRDVQRLQVVRADDDDLLAHVAGDRQAEAAAHHVAQEVEQHVVEAPLVEAELLEQLEAVDDAAPAAAAADFGPAELHREHAVALEADVADLHLLAGELLLRGRLDDRRAGAAAEQQRGGVALRVAADQQHLLALLRHHVGEVGEREALADAALAVDGDDLRLLRRRGRGRTGIGLDGGLGAQRCA